MTRVVRTAALLVVGILAASVALANVPDPAHCTLTNNDPAPDGANKNSTITVGGHNGAVADPCGTSAAGGRCNKFTVHVADFTGASIAGSTVVIDFSGCSDIQIACDQSMVAGQLYLSGHKVQQSTNASGDAVFQVQGASNATDHPIGVVSAGTAVGTPCANVFADGVAIGSLIVAADDVNGLGSTTSTAVSGTDKFMCSIETVATAANRKARCDINGSGTVDATDTFIYGQLSVSTENAKTTNDATGAFCNP